MATNLDQIIKSKFGLSQQKSQPPNHAYYTSGCIVAFLLTIFTATYYFRHFLFTLIYNLVSLAHATFFLFSLFTWLYLLHFHFTHAKRPHSFRRKAKTRTSTTNSNNNEPTSSSSSSSSSSGNDDKFIYSVFLICLMSEFLLQFFIFNFNNNNNILLNYKSNPNSTKSKLAQSQTSTKPFSSHVFLVENLFYISTFFIFCILLLTNVSKSSNGNIASYSNNNNNNHNNNHSNNSRLLTYCKLMFICSLTRVYGCVSFGPILPETMCAYCAYFCAFAGVLFAHYINVILERIKLEAPIAKSVEKRPRTISSAAALPRDESYAFGGGESNGEEDDDDDDDDEDDEEMDMRIFKLPPIDNRQRFQHRQSYLTQAGFKRRTSLPTIPLKLDKNSIPDYSIILKEIKAKIDDLMGDTSTNSIEPSHSISRLLNGLRTIRNLISRSNHSMPNVTHNHSTSTTSSRSCSTKSTVRAAEPKSTTAQNPMTSAKVLNKKKFEIINTNSHFSNDFGNNDDDDNNNDEDNDVGELEAGCGGGEDGGEGDIGGGRDEDDDDDDDDEGIHRRNSYSADEDDEDRRQQMVNNSSIEAIRKQHRNRKSLPTHFYRRLFNPSSIITPVLSNQTSGIKFDTSSRQRSLSLKHGSINSNTTLENAKRLQQQIINQNETSPLQNSHKYLKRQSSENHLPQPATTISSNIPIIQNEPKSQNNILNEKSNSNVCNRCSDESKTYFNEDEESTNPNISAHSKANNSQNSKTSDYESGESPTNSDYNSDTDKLHLKQNYHESHYHEILSLKKLEEIKEELTNRSKNQVAISNENAAVWQIEDLQKNTDLLNLHDWNFPIFRFSNCAKQFVLSQMAYKIFDEVGLFKTFDIQIDKFINFFTALENGYIDLPYHNKIHAADVLHACYYFTTQAVPNCLSTNKKVSASFLQSNTYRKRPPLNPHLYSLKYCLSEQDENEEGNGYGCLGDNFTHLEILALYCSAAMHDYEHPGRNNAFLVTISSPLALLYNDKSVLENHHASSSWLLLKSSEDFNFLSNLDATEWKRFRYLVLENILATDLSRHFSIIQDFNTKFNKSRVLTTSKQNGILSQPGESIAYDFNESSINWTSEPERLLVSQMILKLADINAPLKDTDLHVQWTERIVQEFYDQGDEESSLGLPISPFMDRTRPRVAKLQENFINALVGSLCDAYTFAGLLPGTVIKNDDEQVESNCFLKNGEIVNQNQKRFHSEMVKNFKSNYDMWCAKLKQEEEQENVA